MNLFSDEAARQKAFPVAQQKIFLAHAAVTTLPRCVAEAMQQYVELSATSHQEDEDTWRVMKETRAASGRLIGAHADDAAPWPKWKG